MAQASDLRIEVVPGDREFEEVGRLADHTQFMVTANLRPSTYGDEECRFLVQFLFDHSGAVSYVDVHNLGLRSAVDRETLMTTLARRVAELGTVTRCPILIQPIEPTLLGGEFAPITVYSEEAPEAQFTLEGGAIVPGWPFGTDA